MSPGELREQIVITRDERTPDGMGGYTVTSSAVATLWAKVTPTKSRDGVIASKDTEIRTHEVVIRSGEASLVLNDLATWGSYALRIKGIRPGSQWTYLDCVIEL